MPCLTTSKALHDMAPLHLCYCESWYVNGRVNWFISSAHLPNITISHSHLLTSPQFSSFVILLFYLFYMAPIRPQFCPHLKELIFTVPVVGPHRKHFSSWVCPFWGLLIFIWHILIEIILSKLCRISNQSLIFWEITIFKLFQRKKCLKLYIF